MRTLLIALLVALLALPASAGAFEVSKAKREKLWGWYRSSGAKCIGSHEGWWTANTGNGYHGKFQANYDFMASYGRHYGREVSYLRLWGTAHAWPKWAQIHMAKHGQRARGWSPWPNTSRMCGLA